MKNYKFAHHGVPLVEKGKLRIQCWCGKQSPIFRDGEETKEQHGQEWYEKHTGIIELKPKLKEV